MYCGNEYYANYPECHLKIYFLFQSDPFFEISKAQEGGTFTLVYRSQPIMKTLNPK